MSCQDLIITAPSVIYKAEMNSGEVVEISNPSLMPDGSQRQSIEEPFVRMEVLLPKDFVGPIMDLAVSKRGEFIDMKYLTEHRTSLVYEVCKLVRDWFETGVRTPAVVSDLRTLLCICESVVRQVE